MAAAPQLQEVTGMEGWEPGRARYDLTMGTEYMLLYHSLGDCVRTPELSNMHAPQMRSSMPTSGIVAGLDQEEN